MDWAVTVGLNPVTVGLNLVTVGLNPVTVWVTTDIDMAMDWKSIPAIAFFVYRKHFHEPTRSEGATIIKIH